MVLHFLRRNIRYFDVIIVFLFLTAGVGVLATMMRRDWPTTALDWLGLGLFLSAIMGFALFRRRAYMQRVPWLLLTISALAWLAMVVSLRDESLAWSLGGSGLLLFGLIVRSKPLGQPIAKSEVFALLSTVGSILFTVVLLEATLRLFPDLLMEGSRLRIHWQELRREHRKWYVAHPYIGHLHQTKLHASAMTARPGVEAAGKRDAWGFRNSWPWPTQVDILAVGDSLVYSQMVDDHHAWPERLAQELPQHHVLNLGLIGGAPQQYLRVYETFGLDLSPKVLLVGLFLGNDLWGARQFERWREAGGKGAFPDFGKADAVGGISGWLVKRMKGLYLHALLQDVRDSFRDGRFLGGKTLILASGERVQLVPSILAQMAAYAQPHRSEFQLVLDTLERIDSLAKAHQTHCVILFFPSKEEVYLPRLDENVPDLAAPFIPELRKRGIAYVDLGPSFRARAAAGEKLFFEVDGHPNEHGYALIAEVVVTYLRHHAQQYGLRNVKRVSAGAGS
ncbi:MAG TPA: SGNH/GDSL hydrolase family protein [Alphaproteobacteria bacterium]|nr:SGNH/GDSL hydrolase family protein [Alphaproteobacteria bacterium]